MPDDLTDIDNLAESKTVATHLERYQTEASLSDTHVSGYI